MNNYEYFLVIMHFLERPKHSFGVNPITNIFSDINQHKETQEFHLIISSFKS